MRNFRKYVKKNKGITLIALVITIVVLIILAAVVISLSLNSNGIFNRAKQAKDEYANSQSYEAQQVNALDAEITKHINDKNNIPNVPAYTIIYNLEGGNITGEKASYTANDEDYTLPTPIKDGCTFIGWTGSNGETPQASVIISKGSTENKEYTANWEKQYITLTCSISNTYGGQPDSYFIYNDKNGNQVTTDVYDGSTGQIEIDVKKNSTFYIISTYGSSTTWGSDTPSSINGRTSWVSNIGDRIKFTIPQTDSKLIVVGNSSSNSYRYVWFTNGMAFSSVN